MYWKAVFKTPRVILLLSLVISLALLALACAPAQVPTAAPEQATPVAAPEATAPAEAGTVAEALAAPTTGKYVERAGLRIFIPDGFEFGGPTIPPDPRTPRYGGTMVIGVAGDPPSIDPFHSTSVNGANIMGSVYERLVHVPVGAGTDPTVDKRIGGLAESWDISNDFLTYTFHLRKGVKWHNLPPANGRELDSEDVKFTFQLFTLPNSIQGGFFQNVDRVEAVDKYTVVYHMKQVDISLVGTLTDYGRGWILPRESANINRRITAIGTGPLQVAADYEYKVGMLLVRNPDYWLKDERGNSLPYLDGRRAVIMPDASARNSAFRTGKIDTGASFPSPVELRSLIRTNPTTMVQELEFTFSPTYMAMRLDKQPWKDVRVRRAMSLAIDYNTWTETLWGVRGTTHVGLNGLWYGQPSDAIEMLAQECKCPWYSYDPKLGKQLLAEAGYPNGFNTTMEFAPSYGPLWAASFELLGAYWKQIGVTVELKPLDYSIWRANLDRGAWTDMAAHAFVFPFPSTVYGAVQQFGSGRAGNPNTGFVNDPKVDAAIKEIDESYRDPARAPELVRQLRAYYLDQVFNLPWGGGHSYSIFAPRLRNYQSNPNILVGSEQRVVIPVWIDNDWAFNK